MGSTTNNLGFKNLTFLMLRFPGNSSIKKYLKGGIRKID